MIATNRHALRCLVVLAALLCCSACSRRVIIAPEGKPVFLRRSITVDGYAHTGEAWERASVTIPAGWVCAPYRGTPPPGVGK